MSIAVKVKLFATFRDVTGGQRVVNIRLPTKATIKDLVEELSRLFGQEIKDMMLDRQTSDLKPFNNILVNGHNIRLLQKLRTRLKNGDDVALFPLVGGG